MKGVEKLSSREIKSTNHFKKMGKFTGQNTDQNKAAFLLSPKELLTSVSAPGQAEKVSPKEFYAYLIPCLLFLSPSGERLL